MQAQLPHNQTVTSYSQIDTSQSIICKTPRILSSNDKIKNFFLSSKTLVNIRRIKKKYFKFTIHV